MAEKSALPFTAELQTPEKPQARRHVLKGFLSAFVLYGIYMHGSAWFANESAHSTHIVTSKACQQLEPLFPKPGEDGLDRMWAYLDTDSFRNESIARHSGAVQIPTQSFDDLGEIGEDKRWDVMYNFADYLETTFPRIHKDLQAEKINTHGLLYTWKGNDDSLKPLVLMSHQDTVPVPDSTVDSWTHPPFSGYYDGTYIWGRGSNDCKNQLIAVMETVELLIKADFKPKRTLILSFGFDEEISGREGAGHLSQVLLDRYGQDGIAAIVDEGAGFIKTWGSVFALPGVAEKGYTDVKVTVRYPGGHSSIPSDHTSIGIISEIVTAVESWRYPTYLADDNPFLKMLQCGANNAPEFPKKLKKLLTKRESKNTCKRNSHSKKKDELATVAAQIGGPMVQYLMQTSQAVDLIHGGDKVNALPERVQATINHRINIGDTPELIYDRLERVVKPIAKKYNLTLHAFDDALESPLSISLAASPNELRVAPVTPTDLRTSTPFSVLAGTIRAIYGKNVTVSPGLMTGNTDCRYVYDLTRHVFRFGPGYDPKDQVGLGSIHTVNERVSVTNHVNAVKWFTIFIRNMDAAKFET